MSAWSSAYDEEDDTIENLVGQTVGPQQPEKEEEEEKEPQSDRKTPRYPSEVKRVARRVSLDLEPEVKDDLYEFIESVAGTRQLSAVAQALLVYALDACRSGRAEIQPKAGPDGFYFEVRDLG